MANKAGILQLVPRGDADATDQVRILVEGLDRSRYQPLVAGQLTPQMRERLSRQNTPWVYLEIPQSFSPQAYLVAAGQLRRLIQARDIALVHCHNMEATAVAVLASRSWRAASSLPIVTTLHGSREAAVATTYHSWARRGGIRWLLGCCDELVASSQHDREQLISLAPHIEARMHVIYPSLERSPSRSLEAGIKRRQVGLHRDAAIIGLLSRLERGQGIESFLEAAAALNEDLPNIEFVIIGEGPTRQELEELAHELGLSGSCIFLGARRDARQVIAALNIIVLLSDADRAALRGLQALAGGLRVIAAPTPALREIFGPLPGAELMETADSVQLAEAIRRQLHTAPQLKESELPIEGRPSIPYHEFLVSRTVYDLEQPWATVASARDQDSAIAQALEQRFGPQRLVREVESIYQKLGV